MKSKSPILIIAEAGVNHNGQVDLAFQLIDAAVRAGADAVKFQTFVPEKVISRFSPKADYQKRLTNPFETQLEMVKRLELSPDSFYKLKEYSDGKGIRFISSPFDLESIELVDTLGLDIIKMPSGEITNLPYLRKIAALNKRIIMSTGMANISEIEDALNILVSYGTDKEKIALLHCTTEYPCPSNEVNLKAMLTIKSKFGTQIGYSDHTLGIEVPIAAAALGAEIIEKHFTLDKMMDGPDHQASLTPPEFKKMVCAIRKIEDCLGNGIKKITISEKKNIEIARKSIVAATAIQIGDVFNEENLAVKRPGTGINPMRWDMVIGCKAGRPYKKDEMISDKDVK